MKDIEIFDFADKLPPDKLQQFLETWISCHRREIDSTFGLRIHQKTTEMLMAGYGNEISSLKTHAQNAEAALILRCSKKVDWKTLVEKVRAFKDQSFFKWDWLVEEGEKKAKS